MPALFIRRYRIVKMRDMGKSRLKAALRFGGGGICMSRRANNIIFFTYFGKFYAVRNFGRGVPSDNTAVGGIKQLGNLGKAYISYQVSRLRAL